MQVFCLALVLVASSGNFANYHLAREIDLCNLRYLSLMHVHGEVLGQGGFPDYTSVKVDGKPVKRLPCVGLY